MRGLWQDMAHLLFPQVCVCCQKTLYPTEKYLCLHCIHGLPLLDKDNGQAFFKLAGRVHLQEAYGYLRFNKSGKTQRLLHTLKYGDQPHLGIYLGNRFGLSLQEKVRPAIDCLIPIPLHPSRQAVRGYNQAETIAQGLSDSLQIPLNTTCLARTREGLTQTRKGRVARLNTMVNCFELLDNSALQGKHVGLVDDVITTGATFEACCLALETVGVGAISVFSLAVA